MNRIFINPTMPVWRALQLAYRFELQALLSAEYWLNDPYLVYLNSSERDYVSDKVARFFENLNTYGYTMPLPQEDLPLEDDAAWLEYFEEYENYIFLEELLAD